MDMTTLLAVLAMLSAVAAAFTWFLHIYNRSVTGILAVAGSNSCFVLGYGMIAARPYLPGFLSFILANGLICAGHLLIIVGLRHFFGRRMCVHIPLIAFVVYVVLFSYWYYVYNNFQIRLVVYLFTYALIMLYALWLTVSEYQSQRLKSYIVSSVFMAMSSLLSSACSFVALFDPGGDDILTLTAVNQAVVFVQILFVVGWTLSFSLMISERLYAEKSIAEQRFRSLVEGAPDAIVVYDLESHRLIDANHQAERLFGCSREELFKGGPERFYAPIQPDGRPAAASFHECNQRVVAGASLLIEREIINAAGKTIFAEVRTCLLPSTSGRLIRGSFLDISERKAVETRLQHLATHDILTGLPNRLLLLDRLEQAMLTANREKTRVALLFLDLDSFKSVNDSFGHMVGDALLQAVGERLREAVRKTDTVSRQGGDEFLLLLANLADASVAATATEHILDNLKQPFDIEGRELYTSGSIGIALFPDDGRDYVTLRKKADLAMYRAKEGGRNTYRFFDSRLDVDVVEHQRALTDLQGALTRGEFQLHYQPQFDLAKGRLVGVEALLRWNHPARGMVPPARFIPLAESSGLIVPIGEWVLREACRQAAAWHAGGLPGLVMAVNLSAVQFKRDNLEQTVADAIAAAGLDPALLELELTESILIRDTETVLATVNRLRRLGVKLSIDDFGTGYSSLSYLKRFDVDKVKIDRSFVRDIATDPGDATIVKAICMMAHGLGLRTVAEGVETEAHLAALRDYACDEAQGYFFAHPMPPAEFLAQAEGWRSGGGIENPGEPH